MLATFNRKFQDIVCGFKLTFYFFELLEASEFLWQDVLTAPRMANACSTLVLFLINEHAKRTDKSKEI